MQRRNIALLVVLYGAALQIIVAKRRLHPCPRMQLNLVSTLPRDLLVHVCSMLDADSIASARLACRETASAGLLTLHKACPLGTSSFGVAARMPGLRHLQVDLDPCNIKQGDSVGSLIQYLSQVQHLAVLCITSHQHCDACDAGRQLHAPAVACSNACSW